jgi:hypothetical protein
MDARFSDSSSGSQQVKRLERSIELRLLNEISFLKLS